MRKKFYESPDVEFSSFTIETKMMESIIDPESGGGSGGGDTPGDP